MIFIITVLFVTLALTYLCVLGWAATKVADYFDNPAPLIIVFGAGFAVPLGIMLQLRAGGF